MYRWNPLDESETYRAASIDRANRGQASGKHAHKVYATTRAMYEGRDEAPGTQAAFVARQTWQIARDNAIGNFVRAIFPERFDGFDLI